MVYSQSFLTTHSRRETGSGDQDPGPIGVSIVNGSILWTFPERCPELKITSESFLWWKKVVHIRLIEQPKEKNSHYSINDIKTLYNCRLHETVTHLLPYKMYVSILIWVIKVD